MPAPLAHTVGDSVDEQPAGESVTESPEGALVVRGHLTPERAKAITQGLSTPVITVGLGLLAVAGVIAAIRGQQGLAALDGVLALYLGWILLSAPARAARRLLRVVGPDPVTWTYTAEWARHRGRPRCHPAPVEPGPRRADPGRHARAAHPGGAGDDRRPGRPAHARAARARPALGAGPCGSRAISPPAGRVECPPDSPCGGIQPNPPRAGRQQG